MYKHHFTSSDTNISLELEGKKVYLDTAISVAYTSNITSVPVYELGSPEAKFFSSGNILIQGQLDIVFTGFEYIPRILAYLVDAEQYVPAEKKSITDLDSMVDSELESLSGKQKSEGYNALPNTYSSTPYANPLPITATKQLTNKVGDSLVAFRQPLNLLIDLDNMNATMNGSKSVIKIKDAKFISHSFATTSRDDTSIVMRYTFFAKNVEGVEQQIKRKQ